MCIRHPVSRVKLSALHPRYEHAKEGARCWPNWSRCCSTWRDWQGTQGIALTVGLPKRPIRLMLSAERVVERVPRVIPPWPIW